MKKQRATITTIMLCSIFFMLLGSQLASAGDGKIAFSKLIDNKFQIVVTDENGQNMQNLSRNGKNDSEPSWSSDGKYIAFVSDRSGNSTIKSNIYIMDANGSNQRLVTKKNKDVDIQEHYPSFSPDGKKLVFTRETFGNKIHPQSNFDCKIYTIDIDGKNEKYLVNGFYAKWSPDGKKISFNPFGDDGLVQGNITIMDTDGRNQVKITDDFENIEASWSRDGKYITFSHWDGNSYEIYKMDLDGNNTMCLTNGGPSWTPLGPSWSPDGKQIVFWDRTGSRIYRVSADGGDPVLISEGGSMDPCWFDPAYASFAVNPSGKYTATWGWIKNK